MHYYKIYKVLSQYMGLFYTLGAHKGQSSGKQYKLSQKDRYRKRH